MVQLPCHRSVLFTPRHVLLYHMTELLAFLVHLLRTSAMIHEHSNTTANNNKFKERQCATKLRNEVWKE